MKATFITNDMHCSNCAIILESIEDDLVGIKNIVACYQKQSLIVQFEPELIDVDNIIKEIEKKGYSIKSYQVEK